MVAFVKVVERACANLNVARRAAAVVAQLVAPRHERECSADVIVVIHRIGDYRILHLGHVLVVKSPKAHSLAVLQFGLLA